MLFNERKCVNVWFFPEVEYVAPFPYSINECTITNCEHHRGLGVMMSNDLSWSRHCHYLVSKAYKSLGMIRRAFKTNSISVNNHASMWQTNPYIHVPPGTSYRGGRTVWKFHKGNSPKNNGPSWANIKGYSNSHPCSRHQCSRPIRPSLLICLRPIR